MSLLPLRSLTACKVRTGARSRVRILRLWRTIRSKVVITDGASGSIKLASGKNYKIDELCLEPTLFSARGEAHQVWLGYRGRLCQALPTKEGFYSPDIVSDGVKLTFIAKDGIDDAATTVQLPSGERVPFL